MKFTYSITLADLQNAQELHWHQTLRRRAIYYSTYWLFPVLATALFTLLLTRIGASYAFFIGFVIAALITTLGFSRKKTKLYRKRFDKNFPPNKRTAWCVIDEDGITSAIVGTDEEKRPWQDVAHFAQNNNITLLYVSEKKFMFIPTNALTMDQRTELLGYVDRHIRNKTSC